MWAEIATRLSLSDCMVSELVCSSWRQNSSVTALGNTITFQHSTSYFAVSKSLRDEQPHIYLDFRCKNKSLVDWTLKRAQGVSSLGFRESSYPADKPWPLRCFLHYLFSRLCNISIPTLDIWLQGYYRCYIGNINIRFHQLLCCGRRIKGLALLQSAPGPLYGPLSPEPTYDSKETWQDDLLIFTPHLPGGAWHSKVNCRRPSPTYISFKLCHSISHVFLISLLPPPI